MPVISSVATAPPKVSTVKSLPAEEEKFPLAKDSLKRLVLVKHEIDELGIPQIPAELVSKLDRVLDRRKQLDDYVLTFQSSQCKSRSRSLFFKEFTNELTHTLYKLAHHDPVKILTEPRCYIDKLKLHNADTVRFLIEKEPLLLIAYLTTDKDLYNIKANPEGRKGALNLLAVLAKQSEYRISKANTGSKEFLNDLDVLMLVSKVLKKVQENDKGELVNSLSKITSLMDDALAPLEIAAFKKASILLPKKS